MFGYANMKNLAYKKILVTGGTGFVGSHLVKRLIAESCEVFVPYRSISPFGYFSTEHLYKNVTLLSCDLKDYRRVLDIVQKYEFQYIIHLAAQPLVPVAFYNPVETLETNIMGSVHILEAARQSPHVRGVIVASSDKAYGKMNKETYVEAMPLAGDHPYDVSKSATDLIAHTYAVTYNLPVVATRFGNIYGEGDLNIGRILPGILESVIRGTELLVRSNGEFIRDYLYVGDVVDGYMRLLMNMESLVGEVFNFGSEYSASVKKLIDDCSLILGQDIPYRILDTQKNEIPYQRLSWNKAYERVGWQPRHTLQHVLPAMFAWYAAYFQSHKASVSTKNVNFTRADDSQVVFSR